MDSELKIYIDRLQSGHTETLKLKLSPDFIGINEPDLKFVDSVDVQGKAYLAEEHLVIQLNLETHATIPCAICNNSIRTRIKLDRFYYTEELEAIKGKIYDYSEPLREAILLEVPSFTECSGNCSKRKELNQFFHEKEDPERINFPFADLN